MPIIVEANEAYAELYASVTGTSSSVVRDLDELRRALDDAPQEYAVVLGAGVNLEAALAMSDLLRVSRPSLSVLLIRRRVDTSVLTDALRAGMREVIEERDLTGLGSAVNRARELWEAINETTAEVHGKNGRLYTVFSSKGGVGKTTISTNLALTLAQQSGARVCLVDLDLAFGDVAITLQLVPARTIEDALQINSGLDFKILETLLTSHSSGVQTLAAPIQPDVKDKLSPQLVGTILRLLKANFDYVVVDSAPSLDEHVLQAIDLTDELVLVSTLDVPTLKNVKVAIETLELLSFPVEKRHLVLNRADDKVGLKHEDVQSTLGMTIAAAIPTSMQVAQATNSGEPIVNADPKHAVSRAMKAFTQRLLEAGGAKPEAAPVKLAPTEAPLSPRQAKQAAKQAAREAKAAKSAPAPSTVAQSAVASSSTLPEPAGTADLDSSGPADPVDAPTASAPSEPPAPAPRKRGGFLHRSGR